MMNHVCSMCYLRDHEDTPWFTPPLGHHLDDPGCRALVGRPDGDVFTVEVEGDFAHVGCEADHVGECRRVSVSVGECRYVAVCSCM